MIEFILWQLVYVHNVFYLLFIPTLSCLLPTVVANSLLLIDPIPTFLPFCFDFNWDHLCGHVWNYPSEQGFSNFLMLRPFNRIFHVAVTPNH